MAKLFSLAWSLFLPVSKESNIDETLPSALDLLVFLQSSAICKLIWGLNKVPMYSGSLRYNDEGVMIHWEHVAYANIVEEEPRSELNAI